MLVDAAVVVDIADAEMPEVLAGAGSKAAASAAADFVVGIAFGAELAVDLDRFVEHFDHFVGLLEAAVCFGSD
jgi:hypothetical protein